MDRRKLQIATDETLAVNELLAKITHDFGDCYDDFHFEEVEVISPEQAAEYKRGADDSLLEDSNSSPNYYVMEADPFQAAGCCSEALVLNFAYPLMPGGGFLTAEDGCEERLCRGSTLFNSITSDDAWKMHDSNEYCETPYYTDYMLLSPNVCVYKTPIGKWLFEPYRINVISLCLPENSIIDLKNKKQEIDAIVKRRINNALAVAVVKGYDSVVLGACGSDSSGYTPDEISDYFEDVLSDCKYKGCFENIIFACASKDEYNAFYKRFGKYQTVGYPSIIAPEQCEAFIKNDAPAAETYTPLKYEFPICNYTEGVTDDNIGYAKGLIEDGVPFVAEKYKNGEDISLAIIIPAIFEREYSAEADLTDKLEENAAPLLKVDIPKESRDDSVLDIGMTDYGQEEDFEYIVGYAEYLCNAGLFGYTTNVRNASIFYRADECGNIFAKVIVSLVENDAQVAASGLVFQDFPKYNKPVLKILK